MIKMKIVLNQTKTEELGYQITNCYDIIDDFFVKNHLDKDNENIYFGNNEDFYLFAYFFNYLMTNTWFFRIVDEFKWYMCNEDNIECTFYDLNGFATLKDISLQLELACENYHNDKARYDSYMKRCNFKLTAHDFLYDANEAMDISKCVMNLFSPDEFYLREELKLTIKRVVITFPIENKKNLQSVYYYLSDKNLVLLPAETPEQKDFKYVPTYSIAKINFPTINQPIIFLDIDGVMQPDRYRTRFNKDRNALKKELAKKYNDDGYLEIDEYDLAAVYYDWSKKAINNLTKLVTLNNAKIVLSTAWKDLIPFKNMLRLFKIHQLDSYILDIIPYASCTKLSNIRDLTPEEKEQIIDYFKLSSENYIKDREFEILKYVLEHNIKKYVALDDMYFENLKATSVCTSDSDYFDDNCFVLANKILNS